MKFHHLRLLIVAWTLHQFIVSPSLVQAECDGNWTQRTSTNSPGAHEYHTMVYDSGRQVAVLFGGNDAGGASDDTWEWNGTDWSEKSPANRPTASNDQSMAYDTKRGVSVLFESTTWEWNGTNWSQKTPANSPSARDGSAMTFDPTLEVVLLFGGGTAMGVSNETWTWDGTNWTKLSPANSPSGRFNFAMATDIARERVVLFGGALDPGNSDETWEWDGNDWTQRSPANSPSARTEHAMAYDSVTGLTVLFGGETAGGSDNQVWTWDGTDWTRRIPAGGPSARKGHAMIFDSARSVSMLFGGNTGAINGETWEYELNRPSISDQPNDQTINAGESAMFSVVAAAETGELTIQWRKDGTPLTDGAGISGAQTNTLTVSQTNSESAGEYDALVSDDCASISSNSATLTVNGCGMCGSGVAAMMPLTLFSIQLMGRRRRSAITKHS